MALSEAQKRAIKKYRENNKEKINIGNYKRIARLFIKNYATKEDMEEFNKLFLERENNKE